MQKLSQSDLSCCHPFSVRQNKNPNYSTSSLTPTMLKTVNRISHQFHHNGHTHCGYIYYFQTCSIVDTLPRHMLPKSPKLKSKEISAKAVLNPMYRDQADVNPYIHFNHLNPKQKYELPLATRWSNILKISDEKIAKILQDHPDLCDIPNSEDHIKQISEFLTETFGGESYMRTMIMRAPLLLDADIIYLQNQINKIIENLSDHVIDDKQSDLNGLQRIEFVLDMIRRQSSILTQNIDGDVIPRILFLKQVFNPYELTQILLSLSSVIVMDFHRLIRIVFIQQMGGKNKYEGDKGQSDKQKLIEISRNKELTKVNLKDFKLNERHLHLIEKKIKNDGIMMDEILKLQPTIMAKVFSDYNYWLQDQIEANYYYHPLLAEHDMLNITQTSYYSEPILDLIDNDDEKKQELLEGRVMELNEDEYDNEYDEEYVRKREKNEKKYEERQKIKEVRKHKTVRQLEILVGDVYKSHTFKQSVFSI